METNEIDKIVTLELRNNFLSEDETDVLTDDEIAERFSDEWDLGMSVGRKVAQSSLSQLEKMKCALESIAESPQPYNER